MNKSRSACSWSMKRTVVSHWVMTFGRIISTYALPSPRFARMRCSP